MGSVFDINRGSLGGLLFYVGVKGRLKSPWGR